MGKNPFLVQDDAIDDLSRRIFLGRSLALSALMLAPLSVNAKPVQIKIDNTKQPWHTLAIVQQHLLPSDGDGPGAKEINALGYLQHVILQQPIDQDEKQFIQNGVGWLEGIAQKNHGKAFDQLNEVGREKVLRYISQSTAGENWISTLLSYIFEALLGDPIYGGNPNKIGWTWLQHQPGFPRPKKQYMDVL